MTIFLACLLEVPSSRGLVALLALRARTVVVSVVSIAQAPRHHRPLRLTYWSSLLEAPSSRLLAHAPFLSNPLPSGAGALQAGSLRPAPGERQALLGRLVLRVAALVATILLILLMGLAMPLAAAFLLARMLLAQVLLARTPRCATYAEMVGRSTLHHT